MRIAAHALTRRLSPRVCCLVWSQNASRAFTAARAMPAARPLTVRGFHCRQQRSRKNSRRVGQALRLWDCCQMVWPQAAAPRRTPLRVQNLRVNNVEIPNNKRIEISLQYIYGIGQTTAKAILRDTVRAGQRLQ